jgi:hypothetical protein
MAIRFTCGNAQCGRTVTAPGALAGKRAKCPYCGLAQQVPATQGDPQPVELEPIQLEPAAASIAQGVVAAATGGPSSAGSPRSGATRAPVGGNPEASSASVAPGRVRDAKARCEDCGIGFPAKLVRCPFCGRLPEAQAREQAANKKPAPVPSPPSIMRPKRPASGPPPLPL